MKFGKPKKINIEDVSKLKGTGYEKTAIRQIREHLLKAFDIYKSNVYYGLIIETEKEHNTIIEWYKNVCDLSNIDKAIKSLKNTPEKIKKYEV